MKHKKENIDKKCHLYKKTFSKLLIYSFLIIIIFKLKFIIFSV